MLSVRVEFMLILLLSFCAISVYFLYCADNLLSSVYFHSCWILICIKCFCVYFSLTITCSVARFASVSVGYYYYFLKLIWISFCRLVSCGLPVLQFQYRIFFRMHHQRVFFKYCVIYRVIYVAFLV